MPILNDISKKFGGAAKTAAKMSGEIVEVTKLNRAISLDEEKLNKIYIELGKALYLKYEKGDSFAGDDLVAWCRQISDLNEEIGYYKEKILQLKNIKLCPNCKN